MEGSAPAAGGGAPADTGGASTPDSGGSADTSAPSSNDSPNGKFDQVTKEAPSKPEPKGDKAESKSSAEPSKGAPADAAEKVAEELLTFKINGEEVSKTKDEWLKEAQKKYAAGKRFEESARIRKEAEAVKEQAMKILNQAKSDPLALLNALEPGALETMFKNLVHSQGAGRDALQKALHYAVEDSKKPEHVRQAEAVQRQQKAYAEQQAREQRRMVELREREVFDAITPHYQQHAIKALAEAGFPDSGPHAERIARDLVVQATRAIDKWRQDRAFDKMDHDTYYREISAIRSQGINGMDKLVQSLVDDLVEVRSGHVKSFLSSADADRLAEALGEEGIAKVQEHLKRKAVAAKEAKAKEALKPPEDAPLKPKKTEPKEPQFRDLHDTLEARREERERKRRQRG